MGFQKFEDKDRGGLDRDPTLTVSTAAGERAARGYLNAAAVREWFEDATHVVYHVDRDESRLGIEPADEDDDSAYAMTFKGGATVALGGALRAYDLDVGDADGSWPAGLTREEGLVVADISDVVEALTDDIHCAECGRRFTESGLKSHVTKVHENPREVLERMDPEDLGGEVPEGDDTWKELAERSAGGTS